MNKNDPVAIVIHGQTEHPFTAAQVAYISLNIDGRAFDVYVDDDDFSFKNGELTIVVDNLPFDLEGHSVELTDIEFDDEFSEDGTSSFINFMITDASDNKGHEIAINLSEWHSEHISDMSSPELPHDPNAPHVEFDVGIFGDCNYPDFILYMSRVYFQAKDLDCSFSMDGRCEMYDKSEADKQDKALRDHYGFSIKLNLPSDLSEGDLTLTNIVFKNNTPEDLKFKLTETSCFSAAGDEFDSKLLINLSPVHDQHLSVE